MISAMHDSQVRGNAQIAEALASMSNTQAEFIFSEATTLPAGTVIRTYYDFSHAFKFNEGENPGVKIFQAEAQRDSNITATVVGGAVTGLGIGFGADLLKSAIKNAGTTHLENSGDGTFTLSGGMGDRSVYGTGGITDNMDSRLASPDSTHDPLVVDPVVVPQQVVQPPPPVVVDPVVVDPVVVPVPTQ
jgi:hypothetical protein